MKNRIVLLVFCALSAFAVTTLSSFSIVKNISTTNINVKYASFDLQDIQFKVINDTQAEFSYAIGGIQKTIAPGQSVGFSYAENTVIHRWTNGQPGAIWFTVKAEMHGNSFQLSSLLTNQ